MQIRIEQNKCFFSYNGKEYTIPSKVYPMNNTEVFDVFNRNNTQEIKDKKIIDIIDSLAFNIGRCYDNTEKLLRELIEEGYSADFYSGWLFAYGGPPIHHAWLILKSNETTYLIDTAFQKSTTKALDEFSKDGIKSRERFATLLKEELDRGKNSDKMLIGQPLENMLYIGNPDSFSNAVQLYKRISNFNNHPSYGGGMNLQGDSEVQKKIKSK